MRIQEIGRKKDKRVSDDKRNELLAKLRKEHSKMVKGVFEFTESPGGSLSFNYRFFPEDLLIRYTFTDGEEVEVPMGLVKHLNNTKHKVSSFGVNTGASRGNEIPSAGSVPKNFTTVSRVKFVPSEFI